MSKSHRSVADINDERRAKYKTLSNTYKMFPVGTKVQVICVAQDFHFFSGKETGVVIRNDGKYLGIIVKFDDKYKRPDFNFEPKNLIVLEARPAGLPDSSDFLLNDKEKADLKKELGHHTGNVLSDKVLNALTGYVAGSFVSRYKLQNYIDKQIVEAD